MEFQIPKIRIENFKFQEFELQISNSKNLGRKFHILRLRAVIMNCRELHALL